MNTNYHKTITYLWIRISEFGTLLEAMNCGICCYSLSSFICFMFESSDQSARTCLESSSSRFSRSVISRDSGHPRSYLLRHMPAGTFGALLLIISSWYQSWGLSFQVINPCLEVIKIMRCYLLLVVLVLLQAQVRYDQPHSSTSFLVGITTFLWSGFDCKCYVVGSSVSCRSTQYKVEYFQLGWVV